MIYAEQDKILPKVANTMAEIKKQIPHATISTIPNCGHFLQEEKPQEVAQKMVEFYKGIES